MSTFSTAYFPCISYMAAFLNDEDPVIEIHDTYQKQTYRNRFKVLTSNGVQTLSVPVRKIHGEHIETGDALISYDDPWQQIHRRCLESAYKSSPYFEHYYSYISPIFKSRPERLIDLNDKIMEVLLKMLKADKSIVHTQTYEKEVPSDFRNLFNSKKQSDNQVINPYYQVFNYKFDFIADLSILDLLFNEGPESVNYLRP